MKNHANTTPVLLLLCCVFFWGSVFPIAKQILLEMQYLSLAVWRFAIALGCLGLYLLITHRTRLQLSLRQLLGLLLIGAIGIGGFNLALFSGLRLTSATNGALIMALSPLVTSLLAAVLARRWLTPVQWASLLAGLAGVGLVITQGHLEQLMQLQIGRGDLLVLLGMLAWSGYTLASQAVSHWLPPLLLTVITMVGGLVALLLYGLFQPGFHPWDEFSQLSIHALGWVFYIGVLATVLGYLFWLRGVQALGAARASLFFNLVPVFASLVALGMGQTLTAIQIGGMLIVLLALSLPRLLLALGQFRRQPA